MTKERDISDRRGRTRAGCAFAVLCAALGLVVGSCSGAMTEPAFPPETAPSTVALFRSRCGTCHAPVEPGTRTRAVMAQALERHKLRAHLSDRDREALVAALSSKN